MIVALCLLAGAVSAGWWMPRWLRACDLRRRDPVLLILCWVLSAAGVALAAVAGVVLLLLPSHGSFGPLLAAITGCWDALQHGSPPEVEQAGGALGLALLGAAACRLLVVGARGIRRRARLRREHLAALRLAGRADGEATVWLAHDRPLAFSLGGRRGVVVATEGLRRHLDRDAVAAVLVHERAHLAGRHHQLVALADALRTALPFLPLFREAPGALRELVELAADVTATRRCGPRAVRSALVGVSGCGAPVIALAMARDAVDVRLARLDWGGVPSGGVRRLAVRGAAGVIAALLPLVVGAALTISAALTACLLGLV
ncbi:M56 family metallopeptidase [Amycolatopsis sp. ATCC 39116]|uniref:M56 family metallopeptidase n=1 Tax=Amycolatopsis sp. (strain ATCC 39116 / 75iv2) TaxID=385957 RepID=UPI0002627D20|nr:M56 family metallopeptidase [Amycolatopsis sp. ATCC 39116]